MKRTRRGSVMRILRRAAALFLATVTVWLLILTANVSAALDAIRSLGDSPGFVSAALRAELGALPAGEGPDSMGRWQRLVLGQSVLLSSGGEAVAAFLAGREAVLPETPRPVEPDDPEDSHQLTAVPSNQDHIIERTLSAVNDESYESGAGVHVRNRTSKEIDVAAMAGAEIKLGLGSAQQPQILIVHTHGSEAYAQTDAYTYVETDPARTTDERCNVIRVGSEMERVFTEMGFSVLHDRLLHDYPAYSGSYERSKTSVEAYLAQYPSIKIVLDVHRDAIIDTEGNVYKAVTTIDGVKTAQVLLVIGSDDGGLPHPQWRENLTLAVQVQKSMNSLWPTLARPITLRTSRFNQQLTPGSLLVEVGTHGNTMEEALAAARLFARSAGQVLQTLK